MTHFRTEKGDPFFWPQALSTERQSDWRIPEVWPITNIASYLSKDLLNRHY